MQLLPQGYIKAQSQQITNVIIAIVACLVRHALHCEAAEHRQSVQYEQHSPGKTPLPWTHGHGTGAGGAPSNIPDDMSLHLPQLPLKTCSPSFTSKARAAGADIRSVVAHTTAAALPASALPTAALPFACSSHSEPRQQVAFGAFGR
jgi:hypothetical protein